MLQVLKIFVSRWWLIVLVSLVSVLSAVAFTYTQPKTYSASTQILIDLKSPDPIAGVFFPGQLMPGFIATQIDIIKSKRVALRVVDTLKLAENPVALAEFKSSGKTGTFRDTWADSLLKGVEIKPVKESSVLTLTYTGGDPKFSAAIANAFARAYIDTSISMRSEPAKESASWFATQTKTLKENLDRAQRNLSEFQRSRGIISGEERFDIENARLQELSSQLIALKAQSVDGNRRQAQANEAASDGTGSQVQEVLGNGLVQSFKADIGRLEGKIQERLVTFGRSHPDVVKMEQELGALRAKLRAEESNIVGSISKSSRVSDQKEVEVRGRYEAQRAKVLALKQQRDDLQLYQREYETAQRAFDSVSQRLNLTNLESQATQTNIAILNPAAVPTEPSGPFVLRNGLLAGILGLLLGVGGALALEGLRRKTRLASDLCRVSSAPVLVLLPKLPSQRSIRKANNAIKHLSLSAR